MDAKRTRSPSVDEMTTFNFNVRLVCVSFFVSSLRFMFGMNVLQPKFSVNLRTWAVKKWYELFIYSKYS